jgi:hypothetical protein
MNLAALNEKDRACLLLSDLFCDNEMSPDEIDSLAISLRSLKISPSTMYWMLRYELFPILFSNLLCVPGEWSGFDDDWLLREVKRRRTNTKSWMRVTYEATAWYLFGGLVTNTWFQIEKRL